MSSALLTKNAKILCHLAKCKPEIRDYIVQNGPKELIECLHKIVVNILAERIPFSREKIKRISKFKKELSILIRKRGSIKNRKKVLQTGGFLPLILGAILPILSSVIVDAITHKK